MTAVLDREFSAAGGTDPIPDLACANGSCACTTPVPALHAGYGRTFGRPVRQAAMLRRCSELIAFTHEWEPVGPGEMTWRERW